MAELRKEKIKLKNGIALVNVAVKKEFKHDAFLPGVRRGRGVNDAKGKLLLPALVAYACANEVNGPEGLRSDMAKAILKADAKFPTDERRYTGTNDSRMKKALKQAGTEKSGWRNHFSNILGILPYGAKLADAKNPKVATPKAEKTNAKPTKIKDENGGQKTGLFAGTHILPANENQINEFEIENSDPTSDIETIIGRTDIGETKKLTLVEARRGQGVFKKNVMRNEKKCRITGVTDLKYLQASHIKPWKDSTDEERLNGYNGLFLSPHVHYLFDKFMISFSDSGELLVSKKLNPDVLKAWGIPGKINAGAFDPAQIKFLEYHRKMYLKG